MHEKCSYSEFFWSVFSHIRTDLSVLNSNVGKFEPEKLRIRTLVKQCRDLKVKNLELVIH